MTRFASVLVLALVLIPAAASAQEFPSINAGARVRVWTSPAAEPVTGLVTRLDASTVTIDAEEGDYLITLTRDTITRLDVSRGHRSRGKNALVGALIGVAAGAIVLAASTEKSGIGGGPGNGLVVLAPVGAVVGFMAGSGPERWTSTTIRPNKRAGLAIAPAPSLRFSLRF